MNMEPSDYKSVDHWQRLIQKWAIRRIIFTEKGERMSLFLL